jgi:glycerophosphoryl diester phosphodiesterase
VRLRADSRPLVIGHRGAAAYAPENTLASLEQAVGLGVDLVEFDVLALVDGTLVLAHSNDLAELSHGRATGRVAGRGLEELRTLAPDLPALDDALSFLNERAPSVGAHLDLKSRGVESSVVEALRRSGMVERAVVSSCHAESLRTIASNEPAIARALTYPCDRFRLSRRRVATPFRAGGRRVLRSTLPARIVGLLEGADATVASLHWSVVSAAAVERAQTAGAAVLAWTVNDKAVLRGVLEAKVDGIITDDPTIIEATLTP